MSLAATPTVIDGTGTAARVIREVIDDVRHLTQRGLTPGLAVVLVGDDAASGVYVRNKILRARECGIRSVEHRLDRHTSTPALLALIHRLNADPTVHGILVQLPLPAGIDATAVLEAIQPAKDVDGFHASNVGALSQGRETLTPCTPAGCMRLLEEACGDLAGRHAVIIGRSNIVGKPLAALLLQADCSVTVLHSRSRGGQQLCRQGDIVIAAVGKPELIDADWIKPGAVVIDVGINRIQRDGRSLLVGDVDYASASQKAAAITPVPGGVGPMTIAYLMKNTVAAARRQQREAIEERQ